VRVYEEHEYSPPQTSAKARSSTDSVCCGQTFIMIVIVCLLTVGWTSWSTLFTRR